MSRLFLQALVGLMAVGSVACGPRIDLTTLEVTETATGWYDNGVKDGMNHLVPSLSFRLKNTGDVPATHVQLTISFWMDGADGEFDGKEVVGITGTPVPPGGSTEPIRVLAAHGYTLAQPRAELFTHSQFRDVTARILAKRDGKIVRIGDVKIDRRLLQHQYQSTAR